METITFRDNPALVLKFIGKLILSVIVGRTVAIICFILMCLSTIGTGVYYGYADRGVPASLSVALIVVTLTIITFISVEDICYKLYKKAVPDPYSDFPFEKGWQLWLIFGPTFMTIFAFTFIFFPLKDRALVIDGKELTTWEVVNPWHDQIIDIKRNQPVSIWAQEITRDGISVRGTIEANFVLGDDPSLWISDQSLQARAGKYLGQKFRATIAKMNAEDLIHEIMIEAGVVEDSDIKPLGLRWEKGSIIRVSNVHVAPPGS